MDEPLEFVSDGLRYPLNMWRDMALNAKFNIDTDTNHQKFNMLDGMTYRMYPSREAQVG